MDAQYNRRHVKISLDRTWSTKFCPDRKFAWYLVVLEVNTAIASGNFQNDGVVQPSLDFQRALAIECLENKIGVELGQNGRPKSTSKITFYVPCDKITVKHHGRMWDPIRKGKKWNRNIKSRIVRNIQNVVKIPGSIVSVPRLHYCSLGALQII